MKKNDLRISIVISDFYPELSQLLFDNCFNQLIDSGIEKESISIYRVSGVFEIPGAVNQISKHDSPSAVVALLERLKPFASASPPETPATVTPSTSN